MSYIIFEGRKVFYNVQGEGKPLLLGHSYLWDSNMWNEIVAQLSKDFCCVSVDLPGHGQSESMDDISLQKLADINKAVMLKEGFQSFSLVGLSIGAMWGAYLAVDDEVTVNEFIICNSSLSPEPPEKKAMYLGMLEIINQQKLIPAPIIDQIAPGFFSAKRVSEFVEDFKDMLKTIPEESISTIVETGRAFIERGNLLENLKDFEGRVMVIAGEFDFYRSLDEAKQILSSLNCELKIIPAGHISAVEEPAKLLELIREFILEDH